MDKDKEEAILVLVKMVERLSFENGEMRGAINVILAKPELIQDKACRDELSAIANN